MNDRRVAENEIKKARGEVAGWLAIEGDILSRCRKLRSSERGRAELAHTHTHTHTHTISVRARMQLLEFQGTNCASRNTRYRNSCTSFGLGLVHRVLANLLETIVSRNRGRTARARIPNRNSKFPRSAARCYLVAGIICTEIDQLQLRLHGFIER